MKREIGDYIQDIIDSVDKINTFFLKKEPVPRNTFFQQKEPVLKNTFFLKKEPVQPFS